MAKLLCSRYIPVDELIVVTDIKTAEDFKKSGYEVAWRTNRNDIYQLTKPQMLEMVFREGDKDYIFNMLEEACNFFKKDTITLDQARMFAVMIALEEIKVTILPDGSYTLK